MTTGADIQYDFVQRYPVLDEDGPEYNSTIKGFTTAILELGAFVGALMAGPLADRYSRKYSISGWVSATCELF